MEDNLIRCKQRFENYVKSLSHLKKVTELEQLSDIEKAGLIQFFEVTFELAWKVMKDYLSAEDYEVKSPRQSIKTAFEFGLIEDGKTWLEALEKRNLASYTYDDAILEELEDLILHTYYPLLEEFRKNISERL